MIGKISHQAIPVAFLRWKHRKMYYIIISAGLKDTADKDTLASIGDSWILPPIYNSVWHESDRRYIIVNQYLSPSPVHPYITNEGVAGAFVHCKRKRRRIQGGAWKGFVLQRYSCIVF